MSDFNRKLISQIKIFHNDQGEEEYKDEKYSFLLYVFEQLEGVPAEDITICDESLPYYKVNVDGFYYDEDSNVYNLLIALYDEDGNDETCIQADKAEDALTRIRNLIKSIQSKSYLDFSPSSLIYDISDNIYKNIKNCEIVVTLLSNCIFPEGSKKNDIETVDGINVSFNTYDLVDLKEKFSQLNSDDNVLDLKEKFGTGVHALKIASTIDFDVYMCSFKGTWLAQLYKEDGQRLLEPNVRSYLKRTQKTNAGIMETVRSYPDMFVSYNNGLSSIATIAEIVANKDSGDWCTINKIHNFQIVNGGQTTATLAECAKDKLNEELGNVVVPVKLTVIKNVINSSMLIGNISVFSNTQTAIKKSDPPSNLKYYIDLKNVSSTVTLTDAKGKNYICYFERTAGEYETELRRNNGTVSFRTKNPKDKKFNKIQLAVAINCWQQLPHVVNNGREKNFVAFNNIVKDQMFEMDAEYFKKAYATIILFRQIDKLCKKQGLSYKSNVVSYTLSYLSYLSNKSLDLVTIFNNQGLNGELVDIINNLLPKIHSILCDAPPKCPEIRMWARKEELWERIKCLGAKYEFHNLSTPMDFFPDNEPQLFINNDDNFYKTDLWRKLLLWNDKQKVLNNSQVKMVKGVIVHLSANMPFTKKQISYAKDIFMAAVKANFNYDI